MNFKKKVLPNGMRIIVVPMKNVASVTVMNLVETGSEYEQKENNGISHFLEHMCFKGTLKRPTAFDITKELDSLGASYNAFTSYEVTGYYAKAHKSHFDTILDIISDIYLNSTFPESEMEKEKGVIVEEMRMYEDMPMERASELLDEVLYGDSPAGRRIIGTEKNVREMKKEDFEKYHTLHYVPAKTVCVVAGAVDPKNVFKKIEAIFKKIPKKKLVKKEKITERQTNPALFLKTKETDQTHMVLGFRAFSLHDKRIPALKMLGTVLSGGMSSRLFQKMRSELGICYYINAGVNDFTDHGHFTISAGVDTSRFSVALSEIIAELKKISSQLIQSEELKKAKDYMIGSMYLGLESSSSLANFYGSQEIMREKIKTPEEIEKEIKKVTAQDIQKLAKSIFTESKMNLAVIGSNKIEENQVRALLHF